MVGPVNRLEALLLAKTLQPAFSSEVRVTPPCSPPVNIPKDSEPFFSTFRAHWHGLLCINASVSQPASQGQILRFLQSALVKASLLESISQPASSDPTDTDQIHHLQSALARVSLHLCINQPASLSPTNSFQELHLTSALVLTPLLVSISPPASFTLTGTDLNLLETLVLNPLPPGISPPASLMSVDLIPTNQNLQSPPTPALLPCRDRDRTVFPA